MFIEKELKALKANEMFLSSEMGYGIFLMTDAEDPNLCHCNFKDHGVKKVLSHKVQVKR